MTETKSKKRKVKAEPKLEATPTVTKFNIPARYIWGESPLKIASNAAAPKTLKALSCDNHLEGVVVGDFIVICNEGCEDTFILHKDVVAELNATVNG